MRNILLAAFGVAALAAGSAALAQGVLTPKSNISAAARTDLLESGDITLIQRQELYPPRGPKPGYYRIRSLHTGFCLSANAGSNFLDLQERPMAADCYAEVPDPAHPDTQLFALVPHPDGGTTIRTLLGVPRNGRAAVPGQISNCLTVAPGVVIGPARIEARACEVPSGAGWDKAGAEGQRLIIQQMAANAWEFRIAGGNEDDPQCIAVRGASRDRGADFIKWGCNGNADQRFQLEWIGPLPNGLETGALTGSKWFNYPAGPLWLSAANGVDLLGPSYSSFETIADKGDYCMKRCAELSECKAWTWTAAGYRGQAKPMCSWKSDPGKPVSRGRTFFGKVFSGIVR